MLITIDGIDGVGKSYIAGLLRRQIRGTVIKGVQDTYVDSLALKSDFLEVRFLYYLASFLDSVLHAQRTIEGAIIFDKSYYSTIAYHVCLGAKLLFKEVEIYELVKPDVKIYLTCERKLWEQRLRGRKALDWYEQRLFSDPSLAEKIERQYTRMGLTPVESRNSDETISEILGLIALADRERKS